MLLHKPTLATPDTRCLWKNPWWITEKFPPPLNAEEQDPNRDICREQIGVSPILMGRRILLRAPCYMSAGGMMYPELSQDNQGQKFQIGFVLAVGKHAYPESETYGAQGHQVFCRPGDWVEYSYWEKTSCVLNENSPVGQGDEYHLFYVNDLHINAVIQPRDYPIILQNRC